MDRSVLARKQLTELKDIAASLQMRGYQRLRKADLIDAIIDRGGNGRSSDAATPGVATDELGVRPSPRTLRTRSRSGADAGDQQQLLETEGATSDGVTNGASGTRARGVGSRQGRAERVLEAGAEEARDQAAAGRDGIAEDERGDGRTRTRARRTDRDRTPADGGDQTDVPDRAGGKDPNSGERDAGGQDRGDLEQTDGGDRDQGDRDQGDRDGGDQDRGDQGSRGNRDDNDGGGRRSRRSRRERRRNKDKQQQQQQRRDDDGGGDAEPGEVRSGVLDILPEGYGFLRTSGYLPGDKDAYLSQNMVRRHGLRRGDVIEGPIRQQRPNDKVPALHHITAIEGEKVDENYQPAHRADFKDMTPLFPEERLRLETPDGPMSARIIDLMSPIGKGQRGLVVSPPKAGKTTILKELGQAIAFNNPECHLMVVLVDERPEEVTDMQRSVPGEIIASTFDRPADDHTQIAELAMERAKRLVEQGRDVVVLLDSITRLARAYNLAAPASGRIMSGGVDSSALYPPKRFFGAARNIEGGGSLTIIATALIETGSKMDEVIFEEFKGTGNMELRLDRTLEQKRIFPAIDIDASGTRKEELLLDREELTIIWKLRRVLAALDGPGALELLIDKMRQTRSNNQFLVQIQKSNLQT